MSTLTHFEPNKFSAGALALVVHAIFFSLLYFGINWHVKTPPNMVVEMWDTLPDPVTEIAPVPAPPPLPVPILQKAETISVPKAVEPVAVVPPEIAIKEKKKKKLAPEKKQKIIVKKPPKQTAKIQLEIEKQRSLAAHVELSKQQELEAQKEQDIVLDAEEHAARESERIQEHKAKMRAEMDAATASDVAKYKDLIQAKISRNIVMPPDVPDSAEAIFLVIVLPGGLVMDNVKLEKSSGNAAYDSAAERAIYKAQPLPVPQDAALARMFRELRLSVKP